MVFPVFLLKVENIGVQKQKTKEETEVDRIHVRKNCDRLWFLLVIVQRKQPIVSADDAEEKNEEKEG